MFILKNIILCHILIFNWINRSMFLLLYPNQDYSHNQNDGFMKSLDYG